MVIVALLDVSEKKILQRFHARIFVDYCSIAMQFGAVCENQHVSEKENFKF